MSICVALCHTGVKLSRMAAPIQSKCKGRDQLRMAKSNSDGVDSKCKNVYFEFDLTCDVIGDLDVNDIECSINFLGLSNSV